MVPFLDLKAQHEQMKPEIDAAVMRVIDSAQFVLGPEVAAFEERFAAILRRQVLRGAQQWNLGTSLGSACGWHWSGR